MSDAQNSISSLDIVNRQVCSVLAKYFVKGMHIGLKNVVYTPAQDLQTDLYRVRQTGENQSVTNFPALVVSRTGISRVWGERATTHKFESLVDGRLLKFMWRGVEITYSARVYTETVIEQEELTNNLMVLHTPKIPFHYSIPYIGSEEPFLGTMVIKPSAITTKVVTYSSKNQEGQIYQTTFNPKVWATLVTMPEDAQIVNRVGLRIFDAPANGVELTPEYNNPDPTGDSLTPLAEIII